MKCSCDIDYPNVKLFFYSSGTVDALSKILLDVIFFYLIDNVINFLRRWRLSGQ